MEAECTAVNDSSITTAQTFTYPDGKKITNSYTSLIEGENADVTLMSLFAKHLYQFGDSLEVVEGEDIVTYVDDMDENTVLNPARMVLKYTAEGSEQMIVLSVEDRIVHGKEKITTPAGTFNCIKFSENHIAKIGDEEIFTQLVCWYDLKDGNLVRQTDLNKAGDITYEVVLVKVEK